MTHATCLRDSLCMYCHESAHCEIRASRLQPTGAAEWIQKKKTEKIKQKSLGFRGCCFGMFTRFLAAGML